MVKVRRTLANSDRLTSLTRGRELKIDQPLHIMEPISSQPPGLKKRRECLHQCPILNMAEVWHCQFSESSRDLKLQDWITWLVITIHDSYQ